MSINRSTALRGPVGRGARNAAELRVCRGIAVATLSVLLAWPCAVFGAVTVGRTDAERAWLEASRLLAALPLRVPRAEALLNEAETSLRGNAHARSAQLSDHAVRMAAKEMQDAFRDTLSAHLPAMKSLGANDLLDELAGLWKDAEAKRGEGSHAAVVALHARALRLLFDFQAFSEAGHRFSTAWGEFGALMKTHSPAAHEMIARTERQAAAQLGKGETTRAAETLDGARRVVELFVQAIDARQAFDLRYTEDFSKALARADAEQFRLVEEKRQRAERLLAAAPPSAGDSAGWSDAARQAAAAYTSLAKTLPARAALPSGHCPEAIDELLRSAGEQYRYGSRTEAGELLQRACRAFTADIKTLSVDDRIACIQRLAEFEEYMSRALARDVVLAAVGEGTDFAALGAGADGAGCQALRRRIAPEGFEVLTDRHEALPAKTPTMSHGFVFNSVASRSACLVMPSRIRVKEGAVPGLSPDLLTFVLVPSGRVFFPDDEGRIREVRNLSPFYLCVGEADWALVAACYADLGRHERKELKLEPTLEKILAETGGEAGSMPARYMRVALATRCAEWLNRKMAATRPMSAVAVVFGEGGVAATTGDRFDVPTVEQWRFAACLDLLARATRQSVAPSYRWWKGQRAKLGWNATQVVAVSQGDDGGLGFRGLFGNVAELVLVERGAVAARRMGGSFENVLSPISSFPLYDFDPEEGSGDLGFRIVLNLDLRMD